MKTLYFDCTNGVSGDMVNMSLKELLGEKQKEAQKEIEKFQEHMFDFAHEYGHDHSHDNHHEHGHNHHNGHDHDHKHDETHDHHHDHDHKHDETHDHHSHDHSNSYATIKKIIESSQLSEKAKEKALATYLVIAKAEAFAHETTIEEVHFHEVGRDEAILNVVSAAIGVDLLGASDVVCSEICDGTGFIECSHGTIPVPVPAVMAMRKETELVFITDESVKTEMVTPSGLALIMGFGAKYSKELPNGEVLQKATVFGKRKTGRDGGFSAYLIYN